VKDGYRMRVEYEEEDLRGLAYDPCHRTSRWAPNVTKAYRRRIQQLHAAVTEQDLRALKSLHLEKLKGDRAGTWSIRIDMQYRLILRFETAADGRIAIVVEAVDYH
jgi:proteic killer suppression protein